MFKYDVGYRKCYILKDGQIFPRQNAREYCKAKAVFFGRSSYTPEDLDQFQEIECKYSAHTYKSISSSDDPDYYVEFRPNEHKRNKNIRVGAMIFIPDDVGVYNLWLIVATDKRPQFPQYYVLQMNWLLKFGTYQSNVMGSDRPQIYFQWCVNRARNSYNSGVWTDYITTSVENQDAIWLATSAVSRQLWYDTRLIIDDAFQSSDKVVAWKVSKVERTHPIGISKFTVTQELYDAEDWSVRILDTPLLTDQPDRTLRLDYYYPGRLDGVGQDTVGKSVINHMGDGTLRVGYSKVYTASFYHENNVLDASEVAIPVWQILFPDGEVYDVSAETQAKYLACTPYYNGDGLKVMCDRDYDLIGSTFLIRVSDAHENRVSTLEIEVTG